MCYDKYKSKSLTSLVIEITRDCNFKCNHCLRGEEEKNKSFNKKLFRKFLIDNNIKKISDLTLSGGEPTLNLSAMKDILELLKHYQVELDTFFIATNGSKLDFEFLEIVSDFYSYSNPETRQNSYVKISNSSWHKEERAKNNIKLNDIKNLTNPENLYTFISDNIIDKYSKQFINEVTDKLIEEQYEYLDENDDFYDKNIKKFKKNIVKELENNNYTYDTYDKVLDLISDDFNINLKKQKMLNMVKELDMENRSIFELENSQYLSLVNNGRVSENKANDFRITKREKQEMEYNSLYETNNFYINDKHLLNEEEYVIQDVIYFSYDGKVTRNCNLDYNQIDKMGMESKVFFNKNMNEMINKINLLEKEQKIKKTQKNSSINLNL